MPLLTNAVGGACGTFGGDDRCLQGFGGEAWGAETSCNTHMQMAG